MKRRSFLKSLGAAGLAPALPTQLFAVTSASPTISNHTYMWAETLARAHQSCNLSMLQRHLQLDGMAAQALQSQLIKRGVIGAQANAFGMHQALNPMFDGLPVQPGNVIKNGFDVVKDGVERVMRQCEVEAGEDQAGENSEISAPAPEEDVASETECPTTPVSNS